MNSIAQIMAGFCYSFSKQITEMFDGHKHKLKLKPVNVILFTLLMAVRELYLPMRNIRTCDKPLKLNEQFTLLPPESSAV